jgi:hypothetical protein
LINIKYMDLNAIIKIYLNPLWTIRFIIQTVCGRKVKFTWSCFMEDSMVCHVVEFYVNHYFEGFYRILEMNRQQ